MKDIFLKTPKQFNTKKELKISRERELIVERWMAGVTEGAVSEKHKAS